MVDLEQAGHHVEDATSFHLPLGAHIDLPEVFGLQLTKFMVLELVAAGLMVAIFVPLARRIRTGEPVRGRFANLMEAMLLFLRDEVARPAIGRHDADRYLPYIFTVFFFILFCNLLGLVPWLGSPTGAISCTAGLAAIAFVTAVGSGMKRFGPGGFFKNLVPHMDLPVVLAVFLIPMIMSIEFLGICIKHTVLAVRLLANIFAGHLVLAVILGFVAYFAHSASWYGVMPASVLGAVGLSLLELLVAFLQAYVFTFLSALFIGMAIHPH
ncbi:MAG TPA: ATP synthase F0 subunit A [Planctomycetes bacterium]|nr:ATP synthase F0 subunit A [Planctomycetota bacterium]